MNVVSNSAQYGGAASAVLFGLTANELAAVGGLVIGVLGFAYNVYDKQRHFKLAKEHAKRRPILKELISEELDE